MAALIARIQCCLAWLRLDLRLVCSELKGIHSSLSRMDKQLDALLLRLQGADE